MTFEKNFIFLITGSVDNDVAAERVVNTDEPVVHHKLRYVPIYQDFSELKRFQIKLRNSVAAFGKMVCVVIDISEWIGHENEEYFIVSLKYFHDKCARMKYVFTVGDLTEKEAIPLFLKIRCFLSGKIETDRTLMDVEHLSSYLTTQHFDKEAATIFAELLMREEMKTIKTIPIIDGICCEMSAESKKCEVELADVQRYLESNQALTKLVCRSLSEEYSERIRIRLYKTICDNENNLIS